MMGKYLMIIALAIISGLLVALWWKHSQLNEAKEKVKYWKAEAETMQYMLDQADTAAKVHRAHLDRMAKEAARTAEMLEFLEAPEDDRALSPLLLRTLSRMRGK